MNMLQGTSWLNQGKRANPTRLHVCRLRRLVLWVLGSFSRKLVGDDFWAKRREKKLEPSFWAKRSSWRLVDPIQNKTAGPPILTFKCSGDGDGDDDGNNGDDDDDNEDDGNTSDVSIQSLRSEFKTFTFVPTKVAQSFSQLIVILRRNFGENVLRKLLTGKKDLRYALLQYFHCGHRLKSSSLVANWWVKTLVSVGLFEWL